MRATIKGQVIAGGQTQVFAIAERHRFSPSRNPRQRPHVEKVENPLVDGARSVQIQCSD
jgi:hypothetical protein